MVQHARLLTKSSISQLYAYKNISRTIQALHVPKICRSHQSTMTNHQDLSSHVQELSKYTACDVADALVNLKVPNAGFLPDLHQQSPRSGERDSKVTIAPASTVLFAWKDGRDVSNVPSSNIPGEQHWVDLTQKDTIVVMSQPEGQVCAVLGGIMALRIKFLQGQGIIVHGRVRDISELQETGLPVGIPNSISTLPHPGPLLLQYFHSAHA